jgi:hypothetical protein
MVSKEFLARGVRKATRLIPGIASYQDKETLREVDKRLREQLASSLDQERVRIDAVKASLVKKLQLEGLDDLDLLTRKLHQLADTVRFAAYGYAPLFDQTSVDKKKLEELYQFDLSLEGALEEVSSAVDTLASAPEGGRSENLSAVERTLGALEIMLTHRHQLLAPEK